ncbi:MAG: ABC transporter ATP-binding protein [Clostridia bacterium]|nr:ABC transporter ATP-binding protein [Clostridia bacterium]
METILSTHELTKEYSHTKVVDGVSLTVQKGDIYGFVGKNGAGKTTFIRMILGLARPDGGTFSMFGGEDKNTARRKTGSLIESPALYRNMNARENLNMYCTMLGLDKKQIDEILTTVGLENTGRKKAKDFSLGMKQRLGIGMALVGDPEFLMLDEPINGLDPKGIVEIRELLLKLREAGKTIFISSHYLGELEKIATRYGIISNGKLVEELTSKELVQRCGKRTAIKTEDPEKAAEILKKFLHTDHIAVGEGKMIYIQDEIEDIGAVTNQLFQAGIAVKGISDDENSAEDYFIRKMEEG